ncbi:MAG: hypothetical protein OEV40_28205 [Acidimicrobiia bacterium]|nr:hypothetical protein [Acidimicrobiia bacterium]
MATTPLNNQATTTGDSPVLAAATPHEKNIVFERLLVAHPELVEETEDLISALMLSTTADEIANEVANQLGALGIEELAGRAGRVPGRGYVHETDAAWELLEEALEPFLTDIRRHAKLGFVESAASIAAGILAGLGRLHGAPDGQLIAFAGDDAIDTLTDTVLGLADDLRLELDKTANRA